MAVDRESSVSDFLSPEDLQKWVQQEEIDVAKAAELRLREARAIAADLASGALSQEQIDSRLTAYNSRWGEALPGTHMAEGVSDEEILKNVDESRSRLFARRTVRDGQVRS